MAAITISRQMGSLGCEVAEQLAKLLGYRVIWRELINKAARLAGSPEMALAAIDELGFLDICPSPEACEAYRAAMRLVMEELANQGQVIIIGRAGQIILQGFPNVFHIRLIAPSEIRASRLMERFGVTLSGARAQISASDRFRKNYLKKFYQVNWNDPELYHMILNTGFLTVHEAAKMIHGAVRTLNY